MARQGTDQSQSVPLHAHAVLAATMLLSIGMAGRLELAALAGGLALRRRRLSDYSRRSWQRPLTIEGG